jgi:hypothetical protein
MTLKRDVSFFHPNVDVDYARGKGIDVDTHPNIHQYFAAVLPPTHPNVQEMLADPKAHPLPGDWYGARFAFATEIHTR